MFISAAVVGICILVLLCFMVLIFRIYKQKRENLSDLQLQVHDLADQKYKAFKEQDFQVEQQRITEEQVSLAELNLEKWKMEYETTIRQDAIKKSQAVTIGKVTEHIIPYFSGVFPYNPKEARFIGSPIDLIVFDGMETDLENITVYFIEVKTNTSSLTPKQRAIKYAILNKRVEWRELRV
jgi:predicted Holliday junction resolvase-like endonuclease